MTECASLDALLQRFGRLDRLGELGESPAAILARDSDVADDALDPIYGRAIAETWRWLQEIQTNGVMDFGTAAMYPLVEELREQDELRFARLQFPSPDAPVLLPAHLDLLCQTSPRPTPEPDITLFLHGKGRGQLEAQVLFRGDLPDPDSAADAGDIWIETLSLVSPTSPEMWTVPLYRLRQWLTAASDDISGDVEGTFEEQGELSELGNARCQFLLWRGRERSLMTRNVRQIKPGDIVVLRSTSEGLRGLAQVLDPPDGIGAGCLDLAERAQWQSQARVVLRLQRNLFGDLLEVPSFDRLLELANRPEVEHGEIVVALRNVLDQGAVVAKDPQEATASPLPRWLVENIRILRDDDFDFRMETHPGGGMILFGNKQHLVDEIELELQPHDDDLSSHWRGKVTLRQHTADVQAVGTTLCAKCLPSDFADAFADAAQAHDLGKLDYRVQLLLQGDDLISALAEPLAKSAALPETYRHYRQISDEARLPIGFRHEFLSMQLAEYFGIVPEDGTARDLALHLISSHHGYARPFAPVIIDQLVETGSAGDLDLRPLGFDWTLTAAERKTLTAAYRLNSGVPERFWRLTRRFGWWGLAYLEAVFRLADWEASRIPGHAPAHCLRLTTYRPPSPAPRPHALRLDALDGANPLAFLAAVGTLRLLTRVFPDDDFRLHWQERSGTWRPLLCCRKSRNRDELVSVLHTHGIPLKAMFSPKLLAESLDLRFRPSTYREFCETASWHPGGARDYEYAATWASELESPDDPSKVRKTGFRFVSGSQRFVDIIMKLRKACSRDDLAKALFDGWQYTRDSPSLRWDPADEKRQYALQAADPANPAQNPPFSVIGANFLAVEALPLFPVVPDRWGSLPGLTDNGGRRWTWPIWETPLTLDGICSLLTIPFTYSEEWSVSRRLALGVVAVFQARIVQPSGRYRCFAPARPI